jgi:hypothetical protein
LIVLAERSRSSMGTRPPAGAASTDPYQGAGEPRPPGCGARSRGRLPTSSTPRRSVGGVSAIALRSRRVVVTPSCAKQPERLLGRGRPGISSRARRVG